MNEQAITLEQIKTAAEQFKSLFEYHAETEDREAFYSFAFTSPSSDFMDRADYKAMSEVIHESGTDENHAYRWAVDCINAVIDACNYANDDDEVDEVLDRITDEMEADIYTYDLTGWLHESNYNVSFIDDALSERGGDFESGTDLLMSAQIEAMKGVYYPTIEAIKNSLDQD